MKALKNILVPTDFSSDSANALKHAAQIADIYSAEICLIHAYRLIQPSKEANSNKNIHHFKKELERSIQNKFTDICSSGLLSVSSRVKFISQIGFPEDVIESHINKEAPDLIVMGTLGQTRANKLFGRTLNTIVLNTNFPVLAIPQSHSAVDWKNILKVENSRIKNIDSSQLIEFLMKNSFNQSSNRFNTTKDRPLDDAIVFSMTKNEYHLLIEQLRPAELLEKQIQFCNPILIK